MSLGCPDAQDPESHQEFRLSSALLWAWESFCNTRCLKRYILDIKSYHFLYWTVAFKFFVLSQYNESYFGCNSNFSCLNKHSTITLQLERGENSSYWGLLNISILYQTKRGRILSYKDEKQWLQYNLKRKKDQAEYALLLSEHCDDVMYIVSSFHIIIKKKKRIYCPFKRRKMDK